MDAVVKVLGELEGRLKARLITGELEIISWLYTHGATSSRALSERTKVSNANYQMILRRLKDEGVLVVQSGEDDRRVRHYDLAPHVRQQIVSAFSGDTPLAVVMNGAHSPWASVLQMSTRA